MNNQIVCRIKKNKPSIKVWSECDGKFDLGKGGAQILETVDSEKSLTKVAKQLGISYRHVWNYIQKTENPYVNSSWSAYLPEFVDIIF